jgi:toxin-antitoxin system PIN domain toxin
VRELPRHEAAREWLDDRLAGIARVGLPWPSLLAFMRLVANPRLFERPVPLADAWGQVRAWLSAPPSWIPAPTERHAAILAELLSEANRPELVPDAHLAALAVEHGLTLCSTDGDFARFSGLRWENPLSE